MRTNRNNSGKLAISLLLAALFISGCSESSNSQLSSDTTDVISEDENVSADQSTSDAMADDATSSNATMLVPADTDTGSDAELDSNTESETTAIVSEPDPTVPNTQTPVSVSVTFEITVPVYVSNALQVRLMSDQNETNANWISDESWTVSENFLVGMEHAVTISFSDRNGDIPLARYETAFTAETGSAFTIRVEADDFDSQIFDTDGDGISNLDELLSGRNPQGADVPEAVQATLELVPEKTFRLQWNESEAADFYRVLENPDGTSGYLQIGDDLPASERAYDHRVALFKRPNARYIVQACNTSGCVDSDEQMVPDILHTAAGIVKPDVDDFPDSFPNVFFTLEYFGVSVILSGDGNSMAVGVSEKKYNDYQNLHYYQGVYVLERIDGVWQKQAYLSPRHDTIDTFFGYTMSFSEDGNTLAIGARSDRNAVTGINSEVENLTTGRWGAAYVFVRTNRIWREQAYIKADNAEEGDNFGSSVSLSSDGNTLAVGASGEDSSATGINGLKIDNSAESSGAVYMFTRSNESWQQHAYIKASNTDEGDGFGGKVAISGDGTVLAVAANGESSAATGINGNQNNNSASGAGAVYVFSNNAGNWEQRAYIKASNAAADDDFASSVALNADGSVLAVGARWESSSATGIDGNQNDNNAPLSGAAYVFTNGGGEWQQQAYIKSGNADESDMFGSWISLNAAGDVLAISASGEGSSALGINGNQNDNSVPGSGAVYVFTNDTEWKQESYIKPSVDNEDGGYGFFVSLSSDGESLAVSSTREGAGAVYLY